MKANFGPSAEARIAVEGATTNRTRAELDRRRHSLKGTNGEIHLVPLALLCREQQLHQVCADGEIRRVAGDDEALKISHHIAFGLQCLGNQANDIVANRVFFRSRKLDAGLQMSVMMSIRINEAPGFCRTTPLAFR